MSKDNNVIKVNFTKTEKYFDINNMEDLEPPVMTNINEGINRVRIKNTCLQIEHLVKKCGLSRLDRIELLELINNLCWLEIKENG